MNKNYHLVALGGRGSRVGSADNSFHQNRFWLFRKQQRYRSRKRLFIRAFDNIIISDLLNSVYEHLHFDNDFNIRTCALSILYTFFKTPENGPVRRRIFQARYRYMYIPWPRRRTQLVKCTVDLFVYFRNIIRFLCYSHAYSPALYNMLIIISMIWLNVTVENRIYI